MKYLAAIIVVLVFAGCIANNSKGIEQLQKTIDSLSYKLDRTYKPGFGEFMAGIQVHHAKLWFAGKEQNWELAQFEIDEMKEAFDGIKAYDADRPEVKSLPMIVPAMDSLEDAVKAKNSSLFEKHFVLLTYTCNDCHRSTNHGFNVITIPATPPFSNQVFKTK